MKKFLKVSGIIFSTALLILYIGFLFVLPRAIDLNQYKADLQKIAEEYAHININFENPELITTPFLSLGIKTGKITVKLPDNSLLLSAESFKGGISLPSLLVLTVKVTGVALDSPQINLDIENDKQFKVVRVIENILNEQIQNQTAQKNVEEASSFEFNPAWIRIKVPALKINNYNVAANDLKSGHSLSLNGQKLTLWYDVDKIRIKTQAEVSSDKDKNISANIDISTFLPPAAKADPDDDPAMHIELPFLNPVKLYRDYNLKADINTKLKIREKNGLLTARGFLDVERLTMNLSGYQLPDCYAHLKFKGTSFDTDSNFSIAENQNIQIAGNINYGMHPSMNLDILSDKIYFNDIIIFSRALLDTLHIRNDLAALKGGGYIQANTQIKTNFKKLKSNGSIIVRDGNISYKKINLVFKDINADLLFDDNMLDIKNTGAIINGASIKIEGQIDKNSIANIAVKSDKLPLPGLFMAFAPSDLKKSYILDSGTLLIDASASGKLKKLSSKADISVENLNLRDRANNFIVSNENTAIKIEQNQYQKSDTKDDILKGRIKNNNLKITLPSTASSIINPLLIVNINGNNIELEPSEIKLNNSSNIKFQGGILQYQKEPLIDLKASGNLVSSDLKKFAGKEAAPFIAAKGTLPLKMTLNGNDKKQTLILQIAADKANYITPVDIKSLLGKQSILQVRADIKKDRLHVRQTGLFAKNSPQPFGDDLETNMHLTNEILGISGTITNLDKKVPFINLIRVNIARELDAKICAFNNSSLKANGNLFIFGSSQTPRIRGNLKVWNLLIPELLVKMETANLNFRGRNLEMLIDKLLLNGSDINIAMYTDLNSVSKSVINTLRVSSSFIDVDKILKVPEALAKYTVASSGSSDIPVIIKSGFINLTRIKSGNIIARNTIGRISLHNNVFYLNNLRTSVFDGTVRGNISSNLVSTLLRINVRGTNLNVKKALFDAANMKDTLSGTMAFRANLSLKGSAYEEQMKSLKGTVNFVIKDGQLGPFGKIENLILAENIRESEFFQTALGGIIDSLTKIETSHFNTLDGRLTFGDAKVKINPITSGGNVMCLHIAGDMNLLSNEADMKVRGKLSSKIADMLGPIAAINPVNLVKATPGLNVVAAQAFSIFTEQITQKELDSIPNFNKDRSELSTSKFQVVLQGDTQKPLRLIKSFKWLALESEMQNAQSFVNTLPTPEQLAAQEEYEKTNKFVRFFKYKEPPIKDAAQYELIKGAQ